MNPFNEMTYIPPTAFRREREARKRYAKLIAYLILLFAFCVAATIINANVTPAEAKPVYNTQADVCASLYRATNADAAMVEFCDSL